MKRKIILIICCLNLFSFGFSQQIKNPNFKPVIPLPPEVTSPQNPSDDFKVPELISSGEDIDGDDLRYLEKTYTIMLEAKVNVFIPLEIISDINLETTIIGDEVKEIPFDIELNRKPERDNYYSIKYSESVIDIDDDGKPDTYISSPNFVNEKTTSSNYVKIYGKNISKEGKHRKTIYVTVEAGE